MAGVGQKEEEGGSRHRGSCATQQNLWCISKLSGRSVVGGLIRSDTSFVSGGKVLHTHSSAFARTRTLSAHTDMHKLGLKEHKN